MSKLYLILAFHNHQPVGNFDYILEEAYTKSYLPFLETLLGHPGLKVVLHYSGNLLSWIQKRHPEAIKIIRTLVETERAEILSGGFYEPVLPVLPEKDRYLQINELSKFIKKNLGYTPEGIWIAERVWEPRMPGIISKAGLEYLTADDYLFKLTGLEDGDLLGYYITEDEGCKVSVFPGSEKLRYYIPFRTVEDTISYFREIYMRGGNPLLTLADDGEKFGVWPNTHKLCYKDGWLDNFLTEIEHNSDWIETTTFAEYHSKFQPVGRVYLPAASYREMGKWTLPSEVSLEYEYALKELERIIGEKSKQLLRGGIWRSFMVRYPESNHMHKRMFMISQKVHDACGVDRKNGREAQIESWKGQCNDAYWHGIFGGLYLPHLRSAIYRHLLRAESLAAGILKENIRVDHFDFDCDGFDDIIVNSKHITVIATEKSGSLTELSLNKKAVNILDILSRRPEAYHSKITKVPDVDLTMTKTMNNHVPVKEDGLSEYLIYDDYRRSSLLDHFLSADTSIEDMMASKYEELGDFIGGIYSLDYSRERDNIVLSVSREGAVQQNRLKIKKLIELAQQQGIKVVYELDGKFSGLFAVEMNISLLGSPHALIRSGDDIMQIKSMAAHENIRGFSLEDKFLNLGIDYKFSEGIDLWHYPVETISLSENGIERLYQGTSFLFVMNIDLQGSKKFWFTLNFGEDNR
ncbi:MAG: alpha-amylase/4-alpha-glucanotransferase domain-containing protein [Nitrospirota bacterium]